MTDETKAVGTLLAAHNREPGSLTLVRLDLAVLGFARCEKKKAA